MNPPGDAVDFSRVRRALVIKLRHHGDVLLTSPVFSVLKGRAPHVEIDALVYADTADMLTLHPAIAQIHGVDRTWKHGGLATQARGEWTLLRTLRERRYDLLLHLSEHRRGMWLAKLLSPTHAVAPRLKNADALWDESFSHFYTPVPRGNTRHVVETHLDALRRIGIQPHDDERALVLLPGAAAHARIATLLAGHGLGARGFLHLHPASRWMFKTWPAQRSAQLIDKLVEAGHKIVLTCAPTAVETGLLANILSLTAAPVVDLGGQLTLKELAALTAQARAFVGVDSAPMHIAAAMGTPVIALFGPSGEIEWGPWRVAHRTVTSFLHPCRPCGNDGCGGSKVSECLTTLPVARVLDALGTLLDETA